jgi:drug/metabolite transporter (DMT)-like permease
MTFSQKQIGALQVLLAGCCFGFLPIFGKLSYQTGMQVGDLLSYRFTCAALVVTLATFIVRKKLLRVSKHELLVCAGLGAFGYAVFSTFYFIAFKGLSASLAALLLYTFPSFVTLGSWLWLKEKTNAAQKLAVLVAALGTGCLVWGELELRSWLAFAFGLGSGITYAVYILASRRWQKQIHPITSGIYVMWFAALALALYHRPSFQNVTTQQLSYVFGLAVVCTIAPMILFLSGLQKLSGAQASVISTVEPVAATLLGFVFFNEQLSITHFVGGILVLVSVLLTVIERPTRPTAAGR